MIKIIKPGYRKEVECIKCGALLSYDEKEDVQKEESKISAGGQQLLPSSYNQTRNVMMNYEVLANIYRQRKNHKLDEWREFCKWIESLPYSEMITGKEDSDNE